MIRITIMTLTTLILVLLSLLLLQEKCDLHQRYSDTIGHLTPNCLMRRRNKGGGQTSTFSTGAQLSTPPESEAAASMGGVGGGGWGCGAFTDDSIWVPPRTFNPGTVEACDDAPSLEARPASSQAHPADPCRQHRGNVLPVASTPQPEPTR